MRPSTDTPAQESPASIDAVDRGFAGQVRGQEAQPIDMTLARLMRDVYDYDGNGKQEGVGRWKPLADEELMRSGIDPAMLKNESSGFLAVLYGDDQGRKVLAFSGTDETKDWLTNFGQGLGFETAQYNQAMALARQAKVAYGEDLVITGHSLGGGLAAAAAIASDTPAVTFNAAGVNDKTLDRIGLDADAVKADAEKGLIRRYAVENEILTDLQEKTPIMRHLMPDAVGHKIDLPDPDPLGFWQRLNPVKSVKHGVEMHMIDAVIEAQEMKYGKEFGDRALLSDPKHPANALFEGSLEKLKAGADDRAITHGQAQQLAGALTVEVQRSGLAHVDHVAFSADGRRAFAVQGDLDSPTRKMAHVETQQGLQTPLAESSRQSLDLLAAQPQQTPGQEQATQLRARL